MKDDEFTPFDELIKKAKKIKKKSVQKEHKKLRKKMK